MYFSRRRFFHHYSLMSGKRVLAKNNGKRWEKGRSLKAIVSYEYGTGQHIFNQIGDSDKECNREKMHLEIEQ